MQLLFGLHFCCFDLAQLTAHLASMHLVFECVAAGAAPLVDDRVEQIFLGQLYQLCESELSVIDPEARGLNWFSWYIMFGQEVPRPVMQI